MSKLSKLQIGWFWITTGCTITTGCVYLILDAYMISKWIYRIPNIFIILFSCTIYYFFCILQLFVSKCARTFTTCWAYNPHLFFHNFRNFLHLYHSKYYFLWGKILIIGYSWLILHCNAFLKKYCNVVNFLLFVFIFHLWYYFMHS